MSITVQRGLTVLTSDSQNVTISSIDIARSFVLVSATTETAVGSTGSQNWAVTAALTTSTNLILKRQGSTLNANVSWEVVTCDEQEFLAKRDIALVLTGNSSATKAIAEVDVNRTMLISSYRGDFGTTDSNIGMGYCAFNSPTEVLLERGATSSTRTYSEFETVEWSIESGVRVYDGVETVSGDLSSGTSFAHGVSGVTTSNTWLFARMAHASNGLEQISLTATFDATNITVSRHTTTGSYVSKVAWFLVKFPESITAQYTDVMISADTLEDTAITAVTMANSMIFAFNNCAGTGTALGRQALASRLTSTTNIASIRSYNGQECEQTLGVVDFSGWNSSQSIQFLGDM